MIFNYNMMSRLHEFCREYRIEFEIYIDPYIFGDKLTFLNIPTNRRLIQLVDYGKFRGLYDCESYLIDLLTQYFLKNKESEDMFSRQTPKEKAMSRIKKVIFNDPATIVLWSDGTKTVVKAVNEPFDPEKGLAMAISKYFFDNKGYYCDVFRKWIPEEKKEEKQEESYKTYKSCFYCKYGLLSGEFDTCCSCVDFDKWKPERN